MANKPPVKLDYAVLCDEIRKESNGKLFLIGVYTGDILVSDFPAQLALSALLHGFAYEKGEYLFEIRYRLAFADSEKTVVQAKGKIQAQRSAPSEVSIPALRVPIEIVEPARLDLAYRLSGGRWKTILSKTIRLNPASTSELVQPS